MALGEGVLQLVGFVVLAVPGAILLASLVVWLRLARQQRDGESTGSSTGAPLYPREHVHRAERAYLRQRRDQVELPAQAAPTEATEAGHDPPAPVGLALSGGGIRSATTCLGVLQRLAMARVLPHVDYLSTVSGGGYIGSALSSLLSRRPQEDTGDDPPLASYQIPGPPTGSGSKDDKNGGEPATRFDTDSRFPFAPEESPPERDRLTGEAVLEHLRQHGDFLVRHRSLAHRDVLRTGGVMVGTVLYHVGLFALVLLVLAAPFLLLAQWVTGSVAELARLPFSAYVQDLLYWGPGTGPGTWVALAGLGALLVTTSSLWLRWWIWEHRWDDPGAEGSSEGRNTPSSPFRRPLTSLEDNRQFHALWAIFSVLLIGAGACLATLRLMGNQGPRTALLMVPAALAAGAVGAVLLASLWVRSRDYGRNERSRLNSLQGLTLWLFGGTVAFALLVWLPPWVAKNGPLLASSAIAWLGSLGLGRLLTGGTGGGGLGRLPAPLRRPVFSLLAAVLVLVGFVLACCGLLLLQPRSPFGPLAFLAISWGVVVVLLVVVGCLVDANRMAFHYFYRDRLTEAFLQTSGPAEATGSTGGGTPRSTRLPIELLRDDAEMPLTHLHGIPAPQDDDASGDDATGFLARVLGTGFRPAWKRLGTAEQGDGRIQGTGDGGPPLPPREAATCAPYHLLVAALNLTHSRDLSLRSRRAAPFVFSKLFCGSDPTGFVDTGHYREGRTTLATAMTLSAAAASTAMGARTFFAQSFLMALFGVRLGLWLRNPGYKEGVKAHRREGRTFWPWYLLREMLGRTDATGELVLLSDGNHTGDNLGLVPLLERRCRLIVAVDAEMDPDHDFGSLAEALRQAEIDHDVHLDLDLDPVRLPPGSTGGESRSHVAVGIVQYPPCPDGYEREPEGEGEGKATSGAEGDGGAELAARVDRGWLVVIKNSITGDEPEPVVTYRRQNPRFPHESTADQFFSEAQQESYRQLGWHMVDSELPDALWRLLLTDLPGPDWRRQVREALDPDEGSDHPTSS